MKFKNPDYPPLEYKLEKPSMNKTNYIESLSNTFNFNTMFPYQWDTPFSVPLPFDNKDFIAIHPNTLNRLTSDKREYIYNAGVDVHINEYVPFGDIYFIGVVSRRVFDVLNKNGLFGYLDRNPVLGEISLASFNGMSKEKNTEEYNPKDYDESWIDD